MNDSISRPGGFNSAIKPFTGNKNKSVLNPRDIDELVDRINALSNIEIVAGAKNRAHMGARKTLLEINVPAVAKSAPVTDTTFQGIYVGGQVYNALEWVVVQAGPANGAYISTMDGNTNDPATGIGWIQFSALTQWF